MNNFQKAQQIFDEYVSELDKIRKSVEKGCVSASISYLKKLTERNHKLKALGYRVADADDLINSDIIEIN